MNVRNRGRRDDVRYPVTAMRRPVIGVMGAGVPSPGCLVAAHELGKLLAERGWIVLTGGRPAGVMSAACAGAKLVPGSLTLGILPGNDGAGPDVDLAIFTGMGEARNAINVLTSDVVVACGVEGPGTVSEIALALKAEKPVILLRASDPARAFFQLIPGRVFHAAEPADVIGIIEGELTIPPGSAWRD
jgi:uncharacterized protein (TIGR00725 family)